MERFVWIQRVMNIISWKHWKRRQNQTQGYLSQTVITGQLAHVAPRIFAQTVEHGELTESVFHASRHISMLIACRPSVLAICTGIWNSDTSSSPSNESQLFQHPMTDKRYMPNNKGCMSAEVTGLTLHLLVEQARVLGVRCSSVLCWACRSGGGAWRWMSRLRVAVGNLMRAVGAEACFRGFAELRRRPVATGPLKRRGRRFHYGGAGVSIGSVCDC